MVSHRILLSCLLSLLAIPALSAGNAHEEVRSHRTLIILSDTSEYIGGSAKALTQDLIGALQDASSPMLVSAELWQNFVEACDCLEAGAQQEGTPERYVVDRFDIIESMLMSPDNTIEKLCLSDPVVAKNILVDRINAALESLTETIGGDQTVPSRIINYMRCYQVPFYDDAWDVYKVNDFFYLFVPVSYRNTCLDNGVDRNGDDTKITNKEYALGLAVDHLEKIDDAFDMDWMYFSAIDVSDYSLMNALQTVFLSSYDDASYVWDIMLSGHGINSEWYQKHCPQYSKIANMTPEEFTEILDFLDKNLPVNSFWYTSCYGGGMHMKQFVLPSENRDRSFPVVSLCLTDTPSYGHLSDVLSSLVEGNITAQDLEFDVETKTWQLQFNVKHKWSSFFSEIQKNNFDTQNVRWIWWAAAHIVPTPVENIPLVIRAHSQDVITIFPDDCLKLSKEYSDYLQSASRSVKLNADNTSFVLLDMSTVAIPLEIASEEVPLLISVIPGEAVHHLKKIVAKQATLDQLAAMFRPLKGITFNKTFIVDEIICKSDPGKYGMFLRSKKDKTITLKNVIAMCKRDKLTRFFFEVETPAGDHDIYKVYMTCDARCDAAHLHGLQKIKSEKAQEAFKIQCDQLKSSSASV